MQPINPTPDPYFEPMYAEIAAITNSDPAIVTTTNDHFFRDGDAIRMIVPPEFGMTQLNGRIFSILVVSGVSFALFHTLQPAPVPLNSLDLDAYIAATGQIPQIAQAICVGSLPIENLQHTYFETRLDAQVLNTLTQSGGSI